MVEFVRKRDGKLAKFDQNRITNAMRKAFQAVDAGNMVKSKELSDEVVAFLEEKFGEDGVPTVEEIQDFVEERLIENRFVEVSKAYILYRQQHAEMRELAFLLSSDDMMDGYLNGTDWRIRENANMNFSLQGLNNHLSSRLVAHYWLTKMYSPLIKEKHASGALHIHDLAILGTYCVGWDLRDLLLSGFGGVSQKIESRPAKHFRTVLGQVVNFFFTLQGEAAGAMAFSNFDTYLAPFIHYDNLNYEQVVQAMQEFVFNMNVPTRVGFQTPFTNLTLDLSVPRFMEDEGVIVGGRMQHEVYSDFVEEMEMLNKAYVEVMSSGDKRGRVFTFPIVTYNITEDFDWELQELFELVARYGTPYFSNFINSEMKPEDVRSMCCRLRIDNRELQRRGGGFFGSNPLTGSIGVVTINLPRIGFLKKDEDTFFEELGHLMDIARDSLEIKRKTIENLTKQGLYPYSKFYLRFIKERFDEYWKNHFSTVGLIGMNEALLNLLGCSIASEEGLKFAVKVLQFMRNRLSEYQQKTGNIYNLEATPAEGTSYRLARIDKEKHPDIIVANEKYLKNDRVEPFYTNSSQLPVDNELNLFEALNHQNKLQTLYTGGTVFHIFLGESNPSWKSVSALTKRVAEKTELPYYTITPTFSVCPVHGYLSGEHFICPSCGERCEVYSRVVGYLRPISQWNDGKQSEYKIRKTFDSNLSANSLSLEAPISC
ncbi:MAG: ribonucleoside triphosphate reductase [Candidatus Bathyarchaeia archaeon]